ncbi:gamma carbonic anhydrase family protein [Mucilaginibacter daejeonensis]|uniref:gamma carbonic anhydrase family protein n=1 Tax=Mucilaginibacter daejeonensis TaxID=398049 RepID=UPI001D178EA6|nr:gamma carbonic anhydrase family protein [Mucilaginibacter daejeonensis]UEG53411.1 gamma carbonic anhydrase family protein [Mucilaginibacter daejeonensis]
MPLILTVKDKFPTWGKNCFIADNATIVGDVTMGSDCSVWFNAVIRGDVNGITIGHHTNIQDGVCVHATYLKASITIGNYVSVGHNAIIHGCILHDHVLVGMGAIVMDDAVVETNVIIAAGSVVLERTVCESGYLYAGTPAKKIKPLTEEQMALLQKLPHNYNLYASWFTA